MNAAIKAIKSLPTIRRPNIDSRSEVGHHLSSKVFLALRGEVDKYGRFFMNDLEWVCPECELLTKATYTCIGKSWSCLKPAPKGHLPSGLWSADGQIYIPPIEEGFIELKRIALFRETGVCYRNEIETIGEVLEATISIQPDVSFKGVGFRIVKTDSLRKYNWELNPRTVVRPSTMDDTLTAVTRGKENQLFLKIFAIGDCKSDPAYYPTICMVPGICKFLDPTGATCKSICSHPTCICPSWQQQWKFDDWSYQSMQNRLLSGQLKKNSG